MAALTHNTDYYRFGTIVMDTKWLEAPDVITTATHTGNDYLNEYMKIKDAADKIEVHRIPSQRGNSPEIVDLTSILRSEERITELEARVAKLEELLQNFLDQKTLYQL